MQVFIAEKPSLAGGIAGYLNKHSGFNLKKGKNCWRDDAKNTIVTWAYGHLLYTAVPKDYDPAWSSWTLDTLPLFPPGNTCKKLPRKETEEQFRFIVDMVSQADTVIHCGDPDREGQLLVDEILAEARKEHPDHAFIVNRLLLNALDDESIRKALMDIRDNDEFALLSKAGELRETIDWIIGMNATRYYTIYAHKGGFDGVMNVGRVKAPTLNLIVQREREIKNFKKEKFYRVEAMLDAGGEIVRAQLKTEERIMDKAKAEAAAAKLKGGKAVVSEVVKEAKKETVKTLYSLDTLQTDASRYYDLSPASTLAALQSLYEKKYTSYPRSDCKYLPVSQFDDAGKIIDAVNRSGLLRVTVPQPPAKPPSVYNDSKVTAHHAIVPTGEIPPEGSLKEDEEKVFLLILKKYASLWMPPYSYENETVTFAAPEDMTLILKSRHVSDPGWKALYRDVKADDEKDDTPDVEHEFRKLDTHDIRDALVREAETKPPARYTEGSIIAAMNSIKGETEEATAILKEVKGIGTPATRATIIEELEKNELITKVKKALAPTQKGMTLIDILPDKIKKADYTAEMEDLLDQMQKGEVTPDEVYGKNKAFVLSFLSDDAPQAFNKEFPCPKCGKGWLIYRHWEDRTTKEVREYFRCSNDDCKMIFPVTGKKVKKPKIVKCPKCGKGWIVEKKGKFGVFHSCSNYPACKNIVKEDEWEKMK